MPQCTVHNAIPKPLTNFNLHTPGMTMVKLQPTQRSEILRRRFCSHKKNTHKKNNTCTQSYNFLHPCYVREVLTTVHKGPRGEVRARVCNLETLRIISLRLSQCEYLTNGCYFVSLQVRHGTTTDDHTQQVQNRVRVNEK